MKKLLNNITPLSVLTIVGIILCISEIVILLLSKDNGELATGLLSALAFLFYIIFILDRALISRMKYKDVIIGEIIFLLLLPFIYLYINKDYKIKIETTKQYFIILHDNKGLRKEQIPSSGLFDHSITFKNDSVINLNSTLLNDNDVRLVEPKGWGGWNRKEFDTIVNSNKIKLEIYSNNIPDEERDSIFEKTCLNKMYIQ